jgi:hypothetical protein
MALNDIEERIKSALAPYRFDGDLTSDKVLAGPRVPMRRRRSHATIAVGAAVVVAALVLIAVWPVGAPGGPDPAVASLLHRFERIALNTTPEPVPLPGQYVFTETRSLGSYVFVSGDGQYRFAYAVPQTTQQWLGPDGSGRQVVSTGVHPTFPMKADRATYEAYVASGSQRGDDWQFGWGKSRTDVYGPGELMWRDTSALPTDPAKLGRLIEERQIVGGPAGNWESFVLAADLIRDSYARPELRAALYSYMASLSGIELLGRTNDAIGRPGVALASTHSGFRYEVVFDRSSGKILEERHIVLDPEEGVYENPGPGEYAYAYAGQPLSVATYASFGHVVDSPTQDPSS